MPEYLHPGVYVQERRTGLAPIQGVSTSTMGIVGFTPKGPSDDATLVTSYPDFVRTFGDFSANTQVPTHVYAFFANGGRRAYVVRVTGATSAKSTGYIRSDWAEEVIVSTPNGTTKVMSSAAPTIGESAIDHTDIVPGSISVTFRNQESGVRVAGDVIGGAFPTMTLTLGIPVFTASMVGKYISLNGCTTPANDGDWPITVVNSPTQITFTNAAGIAEPLAVAATWAVRVYNETSNLAPTPAGVAINFAGKLGGGTNDVKIAPYTVSIRGVAAAEVYSDTSGDGILYEAGAPAVPAGFVDYETGHFTITFVTAPLNAADVKYDYAVQGQLITVTDDGSSAWDPPATAGAVAYDTGIWTMTVLVPPQRGVPVKVSYVQRVWATSAISEGVWGDDVETVVRGNENYFARATASFSRHDLLVYFEGELVEMFEDLSFTDPTDARYVGSILNNVGIGSDLVDLTEPSNEDVAPRSLSGYQRVKACGSGNGIQTEFGSTSATPAIPTPFRTGALEAPVQPGSIVISFVDLAGAVRTITDDGDGNLIGNVATGTGFNVVNYDTGVFAFKASAAPGNYVQAGEFSVPVVTYYKEPTETTQDDTLSGGSDGAALTRNELTDPALKATRKGMYALLPTNELINLTIPDAAGNVTMSNDQVTEAETNGLWFVVLATPPGYTPTQAKSWRINTLGVTSSYAALYYPYIQITDPVNDLPANVPPGGHIAGVYARTDANKSVGKAPAGTDDGKLLFATGVERKLEFSEVDVLHPNQVNAIMDTPQTGLCVWGARTLERPPSDFRFVHVRRLFNFLKASIFNSTHGFVFENVGPALWGRIKMSVESFLLVLYSQGMFAGTSPKEAFAVICDETNNPQAVQDAGQVICDIYVAANTPGEFIIFRIQQKIRTTA